MKTAFTTINWLVLILLLVSSNGCMTYTAVYNGSAHKYQRVEGFNPDEDNWVEMDKGWQPSYYLLVPLTIPADVLTSPAQLLLFSNYGSYKIYADGSTSWGRDLVRQ